jgi:protein-disulfide isomerase
MDFSTCRSIRWQAQNPLNICINQAADPMSCFVRSARPASAVRQRVCMLSAVAAVLLLAMAAPLARAQFSVPEAGTEVHDPSALKPPAGARVAIVEFADLECPACASANPLLKAAVAKYKIAWVRHDFLIPTHKWSTSGAVNARWFDAKDLALGSEYRDQLFANQTFIYGPYALRRFTEEFAQSHGIELPSSLDPDGKLTDEVLADSELGKRTGIQHTPTVFIVTAGGKGAPFLEVQHIDQDLDRMIEQALADTGGANPSGK